MITSVSDWIVFLRSSDALIGFPLIIAGAVLSVFGWRMWKICVVVSFGLLGAAIGTHFAGTGENQLLYAACCAVALGVLSYWPAHYSLAALGGIIGCGAALHFVSGLRLDPITVWIIGVLGFLGCTAYALINRQLVVIFVTAFLGAVLVMSGLTAFIMEFPPVYGTFSSLAAGSVLVVPFILLVPSVMSSFYQIAEIRRLGKDL